jgi:hypothetical protein
MSKFGGRQAALVFVFHIGFHIILELQTGKFLIEIVLMNFLLQVVLVVSVFDWKHQLPVLRFAVFIGICRPTRFIACGSS